MQFIGWVMLFRVCICIVLDNFIKSLHCFVFYMQLKINKVSPCMITSIVSLKLYVYITVDLLIKLFWENILVSISYSGCTCFYMLAIYGQDA